MTDDDLDRWRTVADEPADRAVAGYFETVGDREPAALVAALVAHLRLPPEDQVPAIAEFLIRAGTLPDWTDQHRLAAGQAFFSRYALHQFTALYLSSLPNAYAAAKGSHVLWLTARLQDDPERRLNETTQFLMDVTAPGGFEPGGAAMGRVLHVRLMHAAVRWLIDHDQRVARPAEADPTVAPPGPLWAASWGQPANQEDLAGTMLTFSTVVLDAFRRSGVDYDPAAGEDYFYLWRVIGSLLGIADALLPDDVAAGRRLQATIFRRQQQASFVGRELTATLLGLARRRMPRPAAGLAPAMMRRFLGNDVADMIAVPRAGISRAVLAVLVALTRLSTTTRRADPFPAGISERIGRRLLDGLLAADRHGQRVPFAIPDHLGDLA